MKPYLTYTAEEFACDQDFFNWVKYPDRHPKLEAFWRQWLTEHPDKQDIIEEARCLVLTVLAEDTFAPSEQKQIDLWERIKVSAGIEAEAQSRLSGRMWLRIAASVLIIVSVGWFTFTGQFSTPTSEVPEEQEITVVTHVNNADVPKTVILSEGTSIVLQPHSVLEYPSEFLPNLREVSLEGEAYFEVTRDPERPFVVRSGDIVTRVLGTSFTVRNVEDEDNALVRVRTGKVSVVVAEKMRHTPSSDNNVEGVVLMANQQVVYEKMGMRMVKSLVENPTVLARPSRHNFEFADAPIAEVFTSIEEAYGVEIVFDEEALSSCYLNANLDDVPLYEKLKLICKGINATYEIMDSRILVYGKGCREPEESEDTQLNPI